MKIKDFNTSIRVQIDSHNFGKYDISKSVLDFQMEKAIRQTGSCSLTLAPHAEFIDMMEANDIINVYVNLNSTTVDEEPSQHLYNRGWVRIFFGYINDVRRDESVDPEGVYTVRYSITASDFQKALEKTEIYNNPYIDFREEFGRNISGNYLMLQGVVDQGNPRFLIMNHLAALLAFGKQWVLPPHYSDSLDFAEVNEDISGSSIQSSNQLAGFVRLDKVRRNNDALKHIQEIRELAENYVFAFANPAEVYQPDEDGTDEDDTPVGRAPLPERLAYAREHAVPELDPVQLTINVDNERVLPRGLYDVLSFDYMEYTDGFTLSSMIWDFAGPLYSLIEKDSHPVLNELCFDLRPTIDMWSGERDGLDNDLDGALAMVPSVVHREYPFTYYPTKEFSWAGERGNEGWTRGDPTDWFVDAVGLRIGGGSRYGLPQPTMLDFGGPVWVQEDRLTNYGGTFGWNVEHALGIRSYDEPEGTSPLNRLFEFNRGPRVLERIHITNSDVYGSSLGRGDQDVITGYDFVPTNELGEDFRFYHRDLTPQFRLLLLRRHGLRMMERMSDFSIPLQQGAAKLDGDWKRVNFFAPGEPLTLEDIGMSLDQYMTLRVILMTDHWYQHNAEYLNGTITMRPMPGLRPGYKLVWEARNLEFYVEAVSHQWSFPNMLVTTATVTRGQPIIGANDADKSLKYILPDSRAFDETPGDMREEAMTFQLGISFPVADPHTEAANRRRTQEPGAPGQNSPEIIHQNYTNASPKVTVPAGTSDLSTGDSE